MSSVPLLMTLSLNGIFICGVTVLFCLTFNVLHPMSFISRARMSALISLSNSCLGVPFYFAMRCKLQLTTGDHIYPV